MSNTYFRPWRLDEFLKAAPTISLPAPEGEASTPAAAETIPTPEEIATGLFHEIAQGAFLDARMSIRDIGRWREEAVEVIAAALRAAEERGARERWLPIETLPDEMKDGTHFLAAVSVRVTPTGRDGRPLPDHAYKVWDMHVIAVDDETGDVHSDLYQGWNLPDYTHWQPLIPPAQDGGSETQTKE